MYINLKKERIARKQRTPLSQDVEANVGVVMGLVGTAMGILILAIVFVLGPVVGFQVENSTVIPTSSMWNSETNTAITNGTELWQQNTPLLGSAAIVVIAAVIIGVLLGSMLLQRR